jgi:hypothetical protein
MKKVKKQMDEYEAFIKETVKLINTSLTVTKQDLIQLEITRGDRRNHLTLIPIG